LNVCTKKKKKKKGREKGAARENKNSGEKRPHYRVRDVTKGGN